MHEIEYQIFGDDMQFVEVDLDPNEATVAEAGGMMYMEDGVEMETIFGDGSKQQGTGFLGALVGAGKRLLTGESLFMTVFLNRTGGKKKVAFGAPYPGKIIPVHLAEIGGELIAQKDAFLCAAKGVSVGVACNKKIGAGFFGGEGLFVLQVQGAGLLLVSSFGAIHRKRLGPGERYVVDTGHLVAWEGTTQYTLRKAAAGFFRSLVSGEGIVAEFTGPGELLIQTRNLAAFAGLLKPFFPSQSGGGGGFNFNLGE